MLKKVIQVFILSFFINLIWEVWHSALYLNYQGGAITGLILFKAAVVDAIIISILVFAAQRFKINKSLFIVSGALVLAIGIEIWALQTGRWAYNSAMPIIPIIKTGLTPTIQLAITGYIVNKICFWKRANNNV